MGFFREAGEIVNRAKRVRILHKRAKNFFAERKIFVAADDDFDSQSMGTGADDFDGLRMARFGNKENIAAIFKPVRHGHGFRGGGGLVKHRGVGDVERSEFTDHRLKIQQCFEAALGNLGLIRSVLRVPAGIFQHAALDDGRRNGVVIAHSDERAENFVLAGDVADVGERIKFAARGGQV